MNFQKFKYEQILEIYPLLTDFKKKF